MAETTMATAAVGTVAAGGIRGTVICSLLPIVIFAVLIYFLVIRRR